MTLLEIGQTLKTERKRQQLSLEDVYSATKIGLDILKAIEEAESDQLPYHVYARGFIRNYAEFLGISGEEMVQAFDRAVQEDAWASSRMEAPSGDQAGSSRRGRPRTWRSVVLILILLLVLAGLVYFFLLSPAWEQERTKQGTAPSAAENASRVEKTQEDTPDREANASREETVSRDSAGAEENGSEERAEEEESEQPAEEDSDQPGEEEGSEQRIPATEEAVEPAPSVEAGRETEGNRTSRQNATGQLPRHELRIVASEACWISVDVDDDVGDFYLEPGEERTISFRGTGTFLLGNAGGVTLYLDGEERPVQAESGEVREMTLP
ncbi:MAG: DUF4115 domain-containing protein [Desulfohalobiaceae bacterium]|nr:DUF4115 domain-containing protein [Desulfohalobiaceae bacterium]